MIFPLASRKTEKLSTIAHEFCELSRLASWIDFVGWASENMATAMSPDATEVTQLLRRSRQGEHAAIDQVMPLVYQELRRLAASYLRNQVQGHTLQPTALVHEAYLRLMGSDADWKDRAHFFNLAATIMRQILVDHARTKTAGKRGGGHAKVEFRDTLNYSDEKAADLVALDDALRSLAAVDERKARVIELRYFGGLNVEESAEALGVSIATVGRETRHAEAWLRRELHKG
jgi:RNA polymerase sigma-70 factor (ECF subfamily)